jgi:outer membrane protein OmpA-like peptidoglycan-associated protein
MNPKPVAAAPVATAPAVTQFPIPAPALTQPVVVTPPAAVTEAEAPPPAETPADHTAAFLDKIMAYHVPPGTKKKTPQLTVPAAVPLLPVRKPVVEATPAVIEAPKAETPAVVLTPVEKPVPKAEQPAAIEKPADMPAVAQPAEEKHAPAGVQERRRKPTEAIVQMPSDGHSDVTIAFDKTSSDLSPAAAKNLDTLAAQLKSMPDQRLQILAYATDADGNDSNARRMALSRGLMVRSYLVDKGIKPVNLDVRALGNDPAKAPSDEVVLTFMK